MRALQSAEWDFVVLQQGPSAHAHKPATPGEGGERLDEAHRRAGEAALEAWAQDPTLPLYGPNGYYPSEMGSYLAALVVFQRIYGRSPVGVQLPAIVNRRVQSWPITQSKCCGRRQPTQTLLKSHGEVPA